MIGHGLHPFRIFSAGGTALSLCAGAALICVAFAAVAQTPPPADNPPPAQAEPPAETKPETPPAAPAEKPGFFDQMNRWLEKSATDFNENLKKMKSSVDEFNERAGKAAKESSDALSKLPGVRIIEAREKCENAPNGSPDCVAAAEKICKGKGFTTGKSVDTQSSQRCPARVWLSGRAPAPGECSMQTFVTRAMCQ